jgi:hypothetical protein
LRRTALTFPAIVIKRIAHFVDLIWEHRDPLPVRDWSERCRCLRHLCLVSKGYRECVTPFLYREISLTLNDERRLSALVSVLKHSTTKSRLFLLEPSGYGSYTQVILIGIWSTMRQSDLAVGVRNLTDRLPGLQLIQIHPYTNTKPTVELSSLTTLALMDIDVAILFDHISTLQALESFQRLSISACHDSTPSRRPLQGPLPNIYLPNLLEISFYASSGSAEIEPFTTISTWTMPRLGYLDFTDFNSSISTLLDFFKLLSTHGPQLQYLQLTSRHLQEQDISTLLALCSGLRSLDIDSRVSHLILSASHARLEKIRLRSRLDSMTNNGVNVAAANALKSLRTNAETSFPKLIKAEITFPLGGFQPRYVMASFRTGDTFITLHDGGKTYRLLDGQAGVVGACFGQVVDCADFFGFGYLSILLEVPS